MLQVLHNNEQMHAYQPFYNGSMKSFKETGTVPDFGQIESAFVSKSPQHEAISNKYATFIGDAITRNAQNAATAPVETPATVGTPPQVVQKSAPVINAPAKSAAPPRMSLEDIRTLHNNQLRKG
jgi:hypothetical protein